jgi:hypothetical protein
MEAWLSAHALRPIARPIFPATGGDRPSGPPAPPAVVEEVDEAALRKARAADSLRRQLRDIADTLGIRDLEKITAFAEFVKARRSARAFAHRQEQHDSDLDALDPGLENDRASR